MYKKICDTCKKSIKGNYVNINLRNADIKINLFKIFDTCEKCFIILPKLLKDNVDINLTNAKK